MIAGQDDLTIIECDPFMSFDKPGGSSVYRPHLTTAYDMPSAQSDHTCTHTASNTATLQTTTNYCVEDGQSNLTHSRGLNHFEFL